MTDSNLPREVLAQIFEYLKFRERLLVSRTCKLWHELIFSPKFCKRYVLYLRSSKDLHEKPKEMYTRCRNIAITCYKFKSHEMNILKDHMNGTSLDFLKISTANRTAKQIVETILEVVPELKTLYLVLKGNSENCSEDVIRIKHQKLECAVLNGCGKYVIECSNLTALESTQEIQKIIGDISCLQRQVLNLKLSGCRCSHKHTAFNVLSNFHWEHLQEISLINISPTDDLEKILKQMPCLQKLSLHGSPLIFTGNEVAAATRLQELKLERNYVDTIEFNKCLTRSSLKGISLLKCTFSSAEEPLKSGAIKSLNFHPIFPMLLPLFQNLEILDLQGMDDKNFCHTLSQICECYHGLERITLGMKSGENERMRPHSKDVFIRNSFSALKKLDKLKVLHLNRIDLTGIDWTTCEGSKVEYIHLTKCTIEGTGAKTLVLAFTHLRTFYLDYCLLRQPRADLFRANGLRSLVRDCRISYHDVHIEGLKRSREVI